jgi:RNA polymerase sigma factor (sigma-70 family)
MALLDRAAFEPLYWRYRDRVYRYLRARTPHEGDAADLTQAVFLCALDVLPRFQGSRGTFAAWLFTLARNMATDFGRRGRTLRHEALSAALHVAGPQVVELEVLRRDDAATLQRALATLPPRKQELLALRFAAGLALPEIGAVMGKSADAHGIHRGISAGGICRLQATRCRLNATAPHKIRPHRRLAVGTRLPPIPSYQPTIVGSPVRPNPFATVPFGRVSVACTNPQPEVVSTLSVAQ